MNINKCHVHSDVQTETKHLARSLRWYATALRYYVKCKLSSTSFVKSIFKITECVFLCHQNLDMT